MNERFKRFSYTQNLNHSRNYGFAGKLLTYLNFDISFSGNSVVKLSFECRSEISWSSLKLVFKCLLLVLL